MGAKAVVIPRVSSKDNAKRAVNAAIFSKIGNRKGNPGVRAARWGFGQFDWNEFVNISNQEIWVILLVKDKIGVENIDEILSVEGVDALSFRNCF